MNNPHPCQPDEDGGYLGRCNNRRPTGRGASGNFPGLSSCKTDGSGQRQVGDIGDADYAFHQLLVVQNMGDVIHARLVDDDHAVRKYLCQPVAS